LAPKLLQPCANPKFFQLQTSITTTTKAFFFVKSQGDPRTPMKVSSLEASHSIWVHPQVSHASNGWEQSMLMAIGSLWPF